MVYDQVGHDLDRAAQSQHIFPCPQPGVHLSVIDGVEPGIRTVNRGEKGQKVSSTKHTGQGPFQEAIQFSETSAGKAVDIRNELNLVFHGMPFDHIAFVTNL